MDRRGTLLVVLVAAAAGFGAGFLTGEARQVDRAHQPMPGDVGASRPTEHLAAERESARAAATIDASPVLEASGPSRGPEPAATPPPGRLTTVSLTVEVVGAGGAPSPGCVLAMRSPASADEWSRARKVLHEGHAKLTLPGPGTYDLLLICKEPHGWHLQRDVEVAAGAQLRVELPAARPVTWRMDRDLPPSTDGRPHELQLSFKPEADVLPFEVLFESGFQVEWTSDAARTPPEPRLLPGCSYRVHVYRSRSAEPQFWAARPATLVGGDNLGVERSSRGAVDLTVDVADDDWFEEWGPTWTARFLSSDGPIAMWRGATDTRDLRGPMRRPDWSLGLPAGEYELVVESGFARSHRERVEIIGGSQIRLRVVLQPDRATAAEARMWTVRCHPLGSAVATELHAHFDGSGMQDPTSWSVGLDAEGATEVPPAWRRARWMCATSRHGVSDWVTPPASGELELALEPAGYVILVPRAMSDDDLQPSFLANLRRHDGKPLIESGEALTAIADLEPGTVIGPLPARPITLVTDVLGGGQMEHVVDVRPGATTVLWID